MQILLESNKVQGSPRDGHMLKTEEVNNILLLLIDKIPSDVIHGRLDRHIVANLNRMGERRCSARCELELATGLIL